MRRSDNVNGVIATVVLLAAAGSATAPPERTVSPPPIPVPAPTVTVQTEPSAPPMPPVSVGPRAPEQPPPQPPAMPPPAAPAPPAKPPVTRPSIGPPTAPGASGRFIVLNFDNADVETVIHAASEIVGFNYVLAPDVRGKVTVQTSGRIPQEDVFGVLLAILELHSFTAVKAGSLYKIVRIEGARERAVPTIIGSAPDPQRLATDEVITQIVPLRYSSVTDLANLIRPLISSRGALIAHRETNILMITDTASNVRRLLDIVRLVDVQVAFEELTIIPVRFADAADLEAILTRLFQTGRLRPGGVTGAPTAAPAPPAPVPGVPTPPRAPTAATPETGGGERIPLIAAVRRSNSLIVHGRKHEIELVRRLIDQLDVNIYGGRRVFIYYAENAKAKDLTATLNAIFGGKETVPTASPTPATAPRSPGQPV